MVLRREMIYSLMQRNNVFLISTTMSRVSMNTELSIIGLQSYRIEEDPNKREEERFKVESAQIQKRRKEKSKN